MRAAGVLSVRRVEGNPLADEGHIVIAARRLGVLQEPCMD